MYETFPRVATLERHRRSGVYCLGNPREELLKELCRQNPRDTQLLKKCASALIQINHVPTRDLDIDFAHKRLIEAKSMLKKVLETDQDDHEARFNLSIVQADLDKLTSINRNELCKEPIDCLKETTDEVDGEGSYYCVKKNINAVKRYLHDCRDAKIRNISYPYDAHNLRRWGRALMALYLRYIYTHVKGYADCSEGIEAQYYIEGAIEKFKMVVLLEPDDIYSKLQLAFAAIRNRCQYMELTEVVELSEACGLLGAELSSSRKASRMDVKESVVRGMRSGVERVAAATLKLWQMGVNESAAFAPHAHAHAHGVERFGINPVAATQKRWLTQGGTLFRIENSKKREIEWGMDQMILFPSPAVLECHRRSRWYCIESPREELLKELCRQNPHDTQLLKKCAWALYQMNYMPIRGLDIDLAYEMLTEAKSTLKKVLETDQEDHEARFNLSIVQADLDKLTSINRNELCKEAIECFEKTTDEVDDVETYHDGLQNFEAVCRYRQYCIDAEKRNTSNPIDAHDLMMWGRTLMALYLRYLFTQAEEEDYDDEFSDFMRDEDFIEGAKEKFKAALLLEPDDIYSKLQLALARLLEIHDFHIEEAVELFKDCDLLGAVLSSSRKASGMDVKESGRGGVEYRGRINDGFFSVVHGMRSGVERVAAATLKLLQVNVNESAAFAPHPHGVERFGINPVSATPKRWLTKGGTLFRFAGFLNLLISRKRRVLTSKH